MNFISRVMGFVRRHKKALLVAITVYVLAIVFLIFFSSGPQNEPFIYQIR